MKRLPSRKRGCPDAVRNIIAPDSFSRMTFTAAVESAQPRSEESSFHGTGAQDSLVTTYSVCLGIVPVGEYTTWIMESEQTCSLATAPDSNTARTPSASWVTLAMGVSLVHCANADGIDAAMK